MFDLAWSELVVIGLVAVLVLGPKELPAAMRTLAKAIRKVRSLGAEFQGHFNEMLREAELDEVRKQVQKFSQTSLVEHVTNYVDPKGEVTKEVTSALQDPDAQSTQTAAEPPAIESAAAEPDATESGVATPGAPDVAAVEPPAETAPAEPAQQKPPAAS